MHFYEEIQNLTEEELKTKVKKRIQSLEKKAKKNNPGYNVLGYHVDYNPEYHELITGEDDSRSIELDLRCFYNNYIWKGTKMVYGMFYNTEGKAGNQGSYYYIDDDSYIYDFCKFIQDKDIINEYELFDYMLEFLRDYFGHIKQIDRNEMFQMIFKDETSYYPAIHEHSIKDFKGKGNAMCSEFAVMAQNLLRFFGFESYLVIGNEGVTGHRPESHAFNLITFKEEESGERVNAVIDFSNYVSVFDINFHKIGESPFIGHLDILDEELVKRLVNGEEHLVFEDYSYFIVNETLAKLGYDRQRDYYISNHIEPDIDVQKRKNYE